MNKMIQATKKIKILIKMSFLKIKRLIMSKISNKNKTKLIFQKEYN